jgi:hypothetical protein
MSKKFRSWRKFRLPTGAALSYLFILIGGAKAALVPYDDLFLPPSLIQDDLYPFHELNVASSQVYTSSEIGGSLLGVRILPLLVPNPSPSSLQGEYTDAQLANISQANYTSYFAALPGVHYFADLTPDEITIDYGAAGSYFVEIRAESGGTEFTKLYYDQVDDAIGQNPAAGVARDRVGVGRQMAPNHAPNSEFILVSNEALEAAPPLGPRNGYSSNALATLQSQGKNVMTADSLDDVIMKIMAESQRLGRPIDVDLVGHGTPGTIQIGNAILSAQGGAMTPAQFGAALKGKVSTINFYSCNTGVGGAGQAFATAITNAAMINSIGAFQTFTSAYAPRPEYAWQIVFVPRPPLPPLRTVQWLPTGRTIPGYFDVGGRGIRGELVPEPGALILVASLFLATLLRRSTVNNS